MQQRDLLKEQIEQLGRVLSKILSDFPGFKSQGRFAQGMEVSQQQLKSELDVDMEEIAALNDKALLEYLKSRKLTGEHIEMLSTYLTETGKSKMKSDKEQAKADLQKAVELLNIADDVSKTMSFERTGKKSELQKLINQCK